MNNPAQSILCHGVRRGEELKYFSQAGIKEVIGTDLYVPTSKEGDGIVEANMNEHQDGFNSRFDVVYSNSVNHAPKPFETLMVWATQLNHISSARIVLKMDLGHSACGSSDLDLRGLDLQRFPFYLSIESNGTLFCDRIVKSNSFSNRYFYFISRRTEYFD